MVFVSWQDLFLFCFCLPFPAFLLPTEGNLLYFQRGSLCRNPLESSICVCVLSFSAVGSLFSAFVSGLWRECGCNDRAFLKVAVFQWALTRLFLMILDCCKRYTNNSFLWAYYLMSSNGVIPVHLVCLLFYSFYLFLGGGHPIFFVVTITWISVYIYRFLIQYIAIYLLTK